MSELRRIGFERLEPKRMLSADVASFDIDGDGRVTTDDAAQVLLQVEQSGQESAADMDGNGYVSPNDVLVVINEAERQSSANLEAASQEPTEESNPSSWTARHLMTSAQLTAEVANQQSLGMRPVRISGYEIGGQDYYAAIWHPVDGVTWQARHGMTSSQYQQEFNTLVGQGYRVTDVNGYTIGGVDYYAAVFEQRSGPAWVARHRMTNAQYQQEFSNLTSQGYRIQSLSGYAIGNQDYYAAVWELRGGPNWGARHRMTSASYQQQYNNFDAAGFDLVELSAYTVGGVDYYAAYWEQLSDRVTIGYHNMTATQYQDRFNSLVGQGWRLDDVDGYTIGGSDRYAATWVLADEPEQPFDEVPITGESISHLEVVDDVIEQFMVDRQISSASVAISKDGQLLYEKALGWKDEDRTIDLTPDSMFRLASVVKPMTAVAINGLISQGLLSRNQPVFCLPGSAANCLLDIVPFGTPDFRLRNINVGHLIDHRGGFDRDVSGDPMFQQLQIAADLGVASPPSKHDIARHVAGRTLDFTPGTRYAYSNFGYLLLGLVIEDVTGKGYTEYLQDAVFNPIGVPDADIELGRSLTENRNPREPWYSDPFSGTNLFNTSQLVPWPDGAFHLESMDSHGGLIASADAITRFLDEYWIGGFPRNGGTGNYTFFGSLPGTVTMARQRLDGLNVAVLFNQRTNTNSQIYALNDLRVAVDNVLNGIVWPVPAVESIAINQGSADRSQLTSLDVTFDAPVDEAVLADAFSIRNVSTGQEVSSILVEASPAAIGGAARNFRLTFGEGDSVDARGGSEAMGHSLADGHYRLDIDRQAVRGAYFGNVMANDHVFGSPNANTLGVDRFFRIYGDEDGDRDVDGVDYIRFGRTFLRNSTSPEYIAAFDFDGDGDVDGLDYNAFAGRFLRSI